MRKKTTPKPQEPTHSLRGPSTLKGYEICPSFQPNNQITKASERGTLLHGVMENHAEDVDAAAEAADDAGADERDRADLQAIQDYLAPLLEDAAKRKLTVLREHTFNLKPLAIPGCEKGTGDLVILDKPNKLVDLSDYKFGWMEVDDPEDNIQTGAYALGCFIEYPWAERVRVRILQPARDEVGEATIPRELFPRWLIRAKAIAERAEKQAGKTFNPTDFCFWCKRIGDCKALHAFALKVHDVAKLEVPGVKDLDPDTLTTKGNTGAAYALAKALQAWAKDLKGRVVSMALNGVDIPGHDLREKKGSVYVVDPIAAQKLCKRFGLSNEDFLNACEPSITRLREAIAARTERGQKGEKEQELLAALMADGCLSSKSPSAFLVRRK